MSLNPQSNHNRQVPLPRCFVPAVEELMNYQNIPASAINHTASPAFPVDGQSNLCHSNGSLSCLDCSFNIHLQPGAVSSIVTDTSNYINTGAISSIVTDTSTYNNTADISSITTDASKYINIADISSTNSTSNYMNPKDITSANDTSNYINSKDVTSATAGTSNYINPVVLNPVKSQPNSTPPNSMPIVHEIFDFKSMVPFKQVLKQMNLEASVSCHIEYLAKQLFRPQNSRSSIHVASYISIFDQALPSSPSALFSPSGIIFTCNKAFSNLVHTPLPELLTGRFCIFSLFDMASILSILDMANRFNDSESSGFGRCSIESKAPRIKRLCASSVSTIVEGEMLWIVSQFIPI